MIKDCIEARAALYPIDEPKASSRRITVARRHLAECPACQDFFQTETSFSRWLAQHFETETAPQRLRQRILSALESPSGSRTRRRRLRLPIAAAALVAAGLVLVLLRPWQGSTKPGIGAVESALIEDHIRYVDSLSRTEVATGRSDDVREWFRQRLHFPVEAPALPGATLRGARLCFLFGSRVALVFYEVQGRTLSLFILDGDTVDLSQGHFEPFRGKRLCRGSNRGYHLALWKQAGLVYAMVSEIPVEHLLQLASAV